MYFDRRVLEDRQRRIRNCSAASCTSQHFSRVIVASQPEITNLFCIKWPFYDPPLAYLIRNDYAITAINSISLCRVFVTSKFWRVRKKMHRKRRYNGKRKRKRKREGKEWILSCFWMKGVKRLSRPRYHPCSTRVHWKPDYRGSV